MNKFAKLFDLDNDSQVLLTIDYNSKGDVFELKIRTDFDGFHPVTTLSFEEEDKARLAMDKYEKKNAAAFRAEMEKNFP